MIKGVVVLLRSGLLVAQRGFERTELLTPLISAVIGLAEELGIGVFRSIEFPDFNLYVTTSKENPEVLIVIAIDKGEPAPEMRIRDLVRRLDRELPRGRFDVVTDDIQEKVLSIIDDFLKEKAELPDFSLVVNLARVIYGGIPSQKIIELEKLDDEFVKTERSDEEKKKFKSSRVKIDNPEKTLQECIDKIMKWQLYEAYNLAFSLREMEDYKDIASLIAAKIGTIIRELPAEYPTIDVGEIRNLINVEPRILDPLIIEYVKKLILSSIENRFAEFRRFLEENADKLMEVFQRTEGLLKDAYAFLIFAPNRYLVRSSIGRELLKYLKEKSEFLYEQLRTVEIQSKIYDVLYKPKVWLDLHEVLSEAKLEFMKLKSKYEQGIKPSIFQALLQRISTIWKKRELLEAAMHLLSKIRPYMLATLAVAESYGLSIEERDTLLTDTYQVVKSEILQIVEATPPLDIRAYFDFYQLISHLMMYLSLMKHGEQAQVLWNETLELSKRGFNFFYRLFVRGRISEAGFIIRCSPVAFTMAKAALRIYETPLEIMQYAKVLASMSEGAINNMNERPDPGRFADIINNLMILVAMNRILELKTLRQRVLIEIYRILKTITTWSIHHGEYTRELVDNIADVVNDAVEIVDDESICRRMVRDLLDYTELLVRDPQESKYEAAIAYERAGRIAFKFLNRFGKDPEILERTLQYLSISKRTWEGEGYHERADDLEQIIVSLKTLK